MLGCLLPPMGVNRSSPCSWRFPRRPSSLGGPSLAGLLAPQSQSQMPLHVCLGRRGGCQVLLTTPSPLPPWTLGSTSPRPPPHRVYAAWRVDSTTGRGSKTSVSLGPEGKRVCVHACACTGACARVCACMCVTTYHGLPGWHCRVGAGKKKGGLQKEEK